MCLVNKLKLECLGMYGDWYVASTASFDTYGRKNRLNGYTDYT